MDLSAFFQRSGRGAAARIARALRVSPVTVSDWSKRKKPVPPDRCPAIEVETNGEVPCESTRPDVAWVRIPDPGWQWHPEGRPLRDVASQGAASSDMRTSRVGEAA